MKLGKLKEVNIRKVWGHEQYGFSAWLSNEENINELGEIIGLNLTDIKTEQFVGNYRCDIICKDEISEKVVLIENQLEATNHDHLGKIITYASWHPRETKLRDGDRRSLLVKDVKSIADAVKILEEIEKK